MTYTYERVKELAGQYGSPFYCLQEDAFADNLEQLTKCFQQYYPAYRLAYSFKTNYTPAICRIVRAHGGFAEVVSDMEYELARKLGFPEEEIIFNGPGKGPLAMEHLLHGGLLNVDSLDELEQIRDFASAHPESKLGVALRLNIDVGQSFISRFGIEENSEESERALQIIQETPNLKLIGLHCHISQARAVSYWKERMERMLTYADRYFTDEPPKYIDLGSGMYGKMDPRLSSQFSNVPTYEDYAQVTAKVMAKHYKDVAQNPILFTEPGATVINKYVDFVTKVTAIKKMRGKTFAAVDGSSHNIGEICKLKRVPIDVLAKPERGGEHHAAGADLVGYTCLEHDVIYPEFPEEVAVGDYLVVRNTGGYSNVLKPPFIAPGCAMIAMNRDGKTRLIKRAETMDDIFATYVF